MYLFICTYIYITKDLIKDSRRLKKKTRKKVKKTRRNTIKKGKERASIHVCEFNIQFLLRFH